VDLEKVFKIPRSVIHAICQDLVDVRRVVIHVICLGNLVLVVQDPDQAQALAGVQALAQVLAGVQVLALDLIQVLDQDLLRLLPAHAQWSPT
jgi:hypothetical protein